MVFGAHFLVPHEGRALAVFSRKHFWHSLKKHVVGFQVVFKNQSSFFSETSSWNPINLQDLNRHFLSKCYVHFLRMVDFCVGSFPQK